MKNTLKGKILFIDMFHREFQSVFNINSKKSLSHIVDEEWAVNVEAHNFLWQQPSQKLKRSV